MELEIKLLPKQHEVIEYLMDDTTTEVLYGGSVGSGKTFLGCVWLIMNCLHKPGSRWLIARHKLSLLKSTTMKTFLDVAKSLGLERDVHFSWHKNSNELTFSNGSEVVLKELRYYPSDPEFDSLGSLEITGAFLDEAQQIIGKARDVVKSRIRYKLTEFNTIGKVYMGCNPSKNFLYTDFYKAKQEGTLVDYRKFVQALTIDNPFLPETYVKELHNMDKNSVQRLLYGNWEYDDDPASLVDYDKILDTFRNNHIILPDGGTKLFNGKINDQKAITCDVARLGDDSSTIVVWDGLRGIHTEKHEKKTTDIISERIKVLQKQYNVPISNIVIDVDGVGGGVADQLKGCYNFNNGAKPLRGENFQHLKAQCMFRLADAINKNEIHFDVKDRKTKDDIIQEFEQIKRLDLDGDGKLKVISKAEMKLNIGRSPDYLDAIMMRMVLLLKSKGSFDFVVVAY